jgi:hypothetical protein
LAFNKSTRNFNQLAAMAGQVIVAEVEEQVEPGEFDPEPDPPARDLRAAGASTHLGAGGAQADRAPERAPSRHRHRRQGGLTRVAHRGGDGRPRALELSDGAYVNLGIGLPALVSNYVPDDVEIVLQSENGILGIGDYLVSDNRIPDLIDAGKGTVTLRQGSAFFDSATSFGMGPRRQGRRSHPRRDACRVFGEVYAAMAEHWRGYETCEELVDLEDNFQLWRFRHLRVVERTFGHKRGHERLQPSRFLLRRARLHLLPRAI